MASEVVRSRSVVMRVLPGDEAVRRALCWLFVATALVYLSTAGSNLYSGDSYSELSVTQSLLDHGWFDVPVLKPGVLSAGWGVLGLHGQYFASHSLGFSLLLMPFYLLAKAIAMLFHVPRCHTTTACIPVHLISWSTCLVTAATVTMLAGLCLDLGYSLRRAVSIALLFAFATAAWPYARFCFDVTPTALLLLWALREALRAVHAAEARRAVRDVEELRHTPEHYWLRAGIAIALAALVRWPALACGVPLGVYALVTMVRRPRTTSVRGFLALVLPPVIMLAFTLWFNWVRFGAPFDDGHALNPDARLDTPFVVGLTGLLISPGKGLLWYSPVVLLALLALPAFLRRHRHAGVLALSIALCAILPYTVVHDWYGGYAWGPRFALPTLPLLLLPVVEAPSLLRTPAARFATVVLVVISVLVQLEGQLVNYHDRLQIIQRAGTLSRIYWHPLASPLLDHLHVLAGYIADPAAATTPFPPTQSFDIWWLNLWRIDRVPREPVLAAGACVSVLAVLASWRLWAAVRTGMSARQGQDGSSLPTTSVAR